MLRKSICILAIILAIGGLAYAGTRGQEHGDGDSYQSHKLATESDWEPSQRTAIFEKSVIFNNNNSIRFSNYARLKTVGEFRITAYSSRFE